LFRYACPRRERLEIRKIQSKDCLDLKQRIDNCFFKNMCYNIITPVK
jgi:hypothetical protein